MQMTIVPCRCSAVPAACNTAVACYRKTCVVDSGDTVLPRNQAHVRKGENTLFWVLIVVHFCSLLGACASYGMQFGMQFVRPHRTRIQTMQS